jgi:7,8-dihydro-6-hydroxymethylpterin dimethyltransferase
MDNSKRDYKFIESTISICPICIKRIDAKIIEKNGAIYLLKYCKDHGEQIELLEENSKYFLSRNDYTKPGTISKTQTNIGKGCPFDCGLCPSHDQHTCIGLIEITNKCDINCPICYANSGKDYFLDLKTIDKMMDLFQESEHNSAEILQISGGEPTIHPDILDIIKLAKNKNFKRVMLNTNGIRIGKDENFVKELSKFNDGFEIYLQFDGFKKETYDYLRGGDLINIKLKAIENLEKYNIPITLVSTIKSKLNDKEIGKIIEFGIKKEWIRGINFQPICFSGRTKDIDSKNRITLTGIIKEIEKQTKGKIKTEDFIPLPCDVDRVAINYLYRSGKEFIPLARNINVKKYIPLIGNTFNFDSRDIIEKSKKMGLCDCNCLSFLNDLRKIIPKNFDEKKRYDRIKYINENTFRISITSFIDVYNFDIKSMKKECVHIITPDLKKIPFSAYNMFYRK